MATGRPLRSLIGCVVALLLPIAARAAPSTAVTLVQQAILAKTPANWQVHVSDRGDFLHVFVTPPYQEAFDLLYQPEELRNRMLGLCPSADSELWSQLRAHARIVIEPSVGGKSALALQVQCTRAAG